MPGISKTRQLALMQGDPIFGLGALAGLVGRGIGALFRKGAKRVIQPVARRLPMGHQIARRVPSSRTSLLKRVATGVTTAGVGGAVFGAGQRVGQMVLGPDGQPVQRRRRRMNPLNPKALRRATRRLTSFNKISKKTAAELAKLAPPRRRSSGGHHHHGGGAHKH